MLDERKLSVLRAIVEEFVSSHEPVGSKAIAERHVLGVSSATIRNDMAALEEEGYIAAPHTSAGRIPTEKGYRLFVDRLHSVKPLSTGERTAIERFLDGAVDLDDIMLRTTKLLAQLTQQIAIVQYPSLTVAKVRHVELVSLGGTRAMLVLIADTGRVEQRVVDLGLEVGSVTLEEIRTRFNALLDGKPFSALPVELAHSLENFEVELRPAVSAIAACLMETVIDRADERIVVAGASHLARRTQEFGLTLGPLLEAIEEQVVLLKLLGEAATDTDVHVRIGHEHRVDSLAGAAVVTTGYGAGELAVGRLGVVGSTHMDYAGSMAAVSAVARYVGKMVADS